ncbi:hypothetical protein N431DRAFT_430646 [Stipitochalara longipes BDJ]|nr:hypothetical protein N431DRAFT_430646 [Stipitochalara longipes BDJ]
MPQGRPRLPGTEAQRAAARRQQIRENVRAFRRRRRERELSENQGENTDSVKEETSSTSSTDKSQSGSPTPQTISHVRPGRQISITRERRDSGSRWELALPFRIDLGPAYTGAFIAAFHYRSSPSPPPGTGSTSLCSSGNCSVSPRGSSPFSRSTTVSRDPRVRSGGDYMRVEICCCEWITTVSFQAMYPGAEMLKDALLASSLNLIGMESDDSRLSIAAMQTQNKALRQLREGFDDYIASRDVRKNALLSATALACSMSELLVNKSWTGYALHLKGVGALIEDAGPAALTSRDSRDNFFGYRTAQVPFNFLERRGSFLNRPEWIKFPWRDSDPRFNQPRDTLLDIAVQIPFQIELYDKTPNRTPNWNRRQLRKLNRIVTQLNQWKTDLFEKYSDSIYTTEATAWEGLHSEYIKFRDDTVAAAFTLYAGVRIELFALVRRLAADLKSHDESAALILRGATQEGFKWSRIACQCLEYFFTRERRVMGKVACLFPFDCAWGTFVELQEERGANMSLELRWCQNTAERIEGSGLPVFRVRYRI